MVEIPLDEQLTDERVWSVLGVLVSDASWTDLDVEALLAEADQTGGRRSTALRGLAERLAEKAAGEAPPGLTHARLLVAALINDVQRYVIDRYCVEEAPTVIADGLQWVGEHLGEAYVKPPLLHFTELFPPPAVRLGASEPGSHLEDQEQGRPNRDRAVRELAILYLAMANRAMRPFLPLFDDADLRARASYTDTMRALEAFFDRQAPVQGLGETLFRLLRAPMEAHPDDLEGQLAFILDRWSGLLPSWLQERLLRARDVLKEETTERGMGGGPPEPPFYRADHEVEAFTPDRDWMANVVLMAKQTYVWLDQLSKAYGRSIRRLDQVPNEELDRLSAWGFSGLWLIGVWERSPASSEIKRRMGNPEALASAYSLYDYVIAEDLGGEASFQDLSRRAWERGIRLAADMVPNHVGVYSKWVVEHPDWFIQLDHPPYPGYRFTGADLSWHPDVEVRIEDGYADHSDAAVVFERRDARTGEVRYIYHGNDGTQMPWNDTAQLDYLNPEVREAAIQTILHVARKFSVIRFDAAMTLAKKHYRRLWFPAPGEGGAIPSRSEQAISPEAFDAAIPQELWREVVDRIAAELPDTLLLAEAFWMMEGYFVRTLGMHRVYNSAFMNMLKMEDNARYRQTIKEVIAFNPEILKRFVNFMNNPDERTAVEQFGKGDKYLGICTLMVTLPGLPMFGHGQIEGYGEKYGMEYARAYWEEEIDEALVARHEREVFPLMRRRQLFSQVDHFVFYDFFTADGRVDEDVFAYSNRGGGDRALVIYHNAYRDTAGWVRTSTPINRGDSADEQVVRPTLVEGLGLSTASDCLHAFRDHNAGLMFLRSGAELAERGLFAELDGYGCHVFLDWRELAEADNLWWQLHHELSGAGVPDLDEARRGLVLRPVHAAFRPLLDPSRIDALLGHPEQGEEDEPATPVTAAEQGAARQGLLDDFGTFLSEAAAFEPGVEAPEERVTALAERLERLARAIAPDGRHPRVRGALGTRDRGRLGLVFALLRSLAPSSQGAADRAWDWRLGPLLESAFADRDPEAARVTARLAPILLSQAPAPIDRDFFGRADIREHLLVHSHEGIVWFHKERIDLLIEAIDLVRAVELPDSPADALDALREAEAAASFQYDKLLRALGESSVVWVPAEADASAPPVTRAG